MYVLGDSTNSVNAASCSGIVLGRSVTRAYASDERPVAFTRDEVIAALAKLPDLDAGFWNEVRGAYDNLKLPDHGRQALLACWGPLPRREELPWSGVRCSR